MMMTNASRLDNAELTAELSRLARCEREATAALIAHLAEFDARRLHEGEGYTSLFRYCMAVLHLSEDAVYNRINAMRAARRYPAIIEGLESGALSLTTVKLLAPHLTAENHAGLLAAACGKSKQAVEELLACRFPQADVVARVRKVPTAPADWVGPDLTAAPSVVDNPAGSLGAALATQSVVKSNSEASPATATSAAAPLLASSSPSSRCAGSESTPSSRISPTTRTSRPPRSVASSRAAASDERKLGGFEL